jgi:hypothetical protein
MMGADQLIIIGTILGILKKIAAGTVWVLLILLIFKKNRKKTLLYLVLALLVVGASSWSEEKVAQRLFAHGTGIYNFNAHKDEVSSDNSHGTFNDQTETVSIDLEQEENKAVQEATQKANCLQSEEYDLEEIINDSDFNTFTSKGKLGIIEFEIGSSLKKIKNQWGEPIESGDYQHLTDYHYYCNVTFFNYNDADINPNSTSDPDKIFGISLSVHNATISQVKQILGAPLREYKSELDQGYYLDYYRGDYLLSFIDSDSNNEIDTLRLWHEGDQGN